MQTLFKTHDFDFRFQCGYVKPTGSIDVSNRTEFINSIWLHHVFFSPHAELQQIRKGFQETLQMEALLCVHSEEIRSILVPSSSFEVSADLFLDQVIVVYSDQGSNKRTEEEAVVLHWSDYIMECGGKFSFYVYMVGVKKNNL